MMDLRARDWIDNLPEREKAHVFRLYERDSRTTFCADTWIRDNPDKTLNLRSCLRTFDRFNLCPYPPNSESCRF